MQQLETKITITIPETMILVSKVEYLELQEKSDDVVGNMKWLMKETDIKSPKTLKEQLLYPFRKELEDFVSYPDNGEHWKFNKSPMKRWLRQNFKRVWR